MNRPDRLYPLDTPEHAKASWISYRDYAKPNGVFTEEEQKIIEHNFAQAGFFEPITLEPKDYVQWAAFGYFKELAEQYGISGYSVDCHTRERWGGSGPFKEELQIEYTGADLSIRFGV